MCIVIYKPQDKRISRRILARCWNNNDDGAGFMYAEGGKLIIEKGFFEFKKFWKAVRQHIHDHPKAVVMHFRIATSGKVDAENCHPFLVHDGLGLAHNGIISDLNDDTVKCDTLRMAGLLSHLPKGFINNDSIMKLIELAVGSSNKFVFMDETGAVKFINEDAGIEVEGVWFSNTSFRYDRSSTTHGYGSDFWGSGVYSSRPSYSKNNGYRYSPHTSYINRAIDTSEGTLGSDRATTFAELEAQREAEAERKAIIEVDADSEIAPSSLFKPGQRFDDFIEEIFDETSGEILKYADKFGYTEDDYEALAYTEVRFWLRHHESVNPHGFDELIQIIELSDEGEPIRHMVQDWLDEYQPQISALNIARQIEAEEKARAKGLWDKEFNRANKDFEAGAKIVSTTTTPEPQQMTPGERVASIITLTKDVAALMRGDDEKSRQLNLLYEGTGE